MIELIQADCLDYMKAQPDQSFALVIADPPYRDAIDNAPVRGMRKHGGDMSGFGDKPTAEYFNEVKRISKNYIIWGGNYFPELWPCKGFIFWHKKNPAPNFSDGELAATSFNKVARCYDFQYFGNIEGNTKAPDRIHPTQKPVKLYEWLLYNYAELGDRILDTHLGSGSSAIAAHNRRFEFVGVELDPEYFKKASKRLQNHQNQLRIF